MSEFYNLGKIRQLLHEGFSKEDLLSLCFEEPLLRPVYEDFEGAGLKSEMVRALLDRAHRQLALDEVLAWAKARNAKRYARHAPYFQDELGKKETAGAETTAVSVHVLKDNHLDHDIRLGGFFQNKPLALAATDWSPYGLFRKVRSGWLFVPQLSESHAVAFFKLHVYDEGEGYIHITNTASPAHPIWLTTGTGFRKEREFHYVTKPVDLWEFRWL